MADKIDFSTLMEPVALRLLGEANARLSKPPRDIRFGTHGSMSVDYEQGKFFDHENNVGGGVLDLVKNKRDCDHASAVSWLRAEGLLNGGGTRRAPPPAPKQAAATVAEPPAKIVATYDYTDSDSRLIFQVVRYEPKDFRQRRPGAEPGTWIWNMEGAQRVPYRLPELIAAVAAGNTVFVVEGEKDVENLHTLGAAATTNPGGVKKWRSEYSAHLQGADVVVIPDNHQEGRDHAKQVCESLHGIAKRIRVLDIGKVWPACPEKGDISDWMERGGNAEKLAILVSGLPDWKATAGDEWPEPKPLPSAKIPVDKFDYALLPTAIRAWVQDISDRMQCPPEYVAVAAITALGSLMGRRLGIRPQEKTDWLEIPNLWGMFIGPPGLMKSPSMSEALKHLHRLEVEAKKINRKASEQYEAEARAYKLRREAITAAARETLKENPAAKINLEFGDEPKEPAALRYVRNDSSYESLGELLIDNPNGILVERDEIVSLLTYLDVEENTTARSFYLTGWSGKTAYAFDRIGRGHRPVEAICLSVIGNTQPARISAFIRQANADNMGGDGLIQRFNLLVWPDTPSDWKNVDEYPNAEAKARAGEVFEKVSKLDLVEALKIGAQRDTYDPVPFLRFSTEAQKEFNEWRGKHERLIRSGELPAALEGHIAKYRTLVPVYALICHVADIYDPGDSGETNKKPLDVGQEISETSLVRSLALAEFLASHARRVYGAGILADVVAGEAILKKIKSGDLVDGFTGRDIQRKGWAHLGENNYITAALDLLVDLHYLAVKEIAAGPKGGRPTASYLINPRVPLSKKGSAS